MTIKQIIDEDFTNYKKPSMHILFGTCNWKCGKEICQNYSIAQMPDIKIASQKIVERYLKNNVTSAVVCNGLEPFDSFSDLFDFIIAFRKFFDDDIVIYTGYTEGELEKYLDVLKEHEYKNIIVKFGRYLPGQKKHYDDVIGVNLASDNQYGKVIS